MKHNYNKLITILQFMIIYFYSLRFLIKITKVCINYPLYLLISLLVIFLIHQ